MIFMLHAGALGIGVAAAGKLPPDGANAVAHLQLVGAVLHQMAGRIQRANYKWIYLFLLPTIVIFAMFYLMPIAQVFVTSFTKWDGFNAPKFNGLTNYINLFTNSSFLIALKNLLWWCVIALTLHVGFGTLVAFVLYQRPHGWKFTRTVFMIPNVISAAAWAMILPPSMTTSEPMSRSAIVSMAEDSDCCGVAVNSVPPLS